MSRNVFKYSSIIASFMLTAVLAGCGSSNKEGDGTPADVPKVSEAACAQCHSTAIDHIAGTPIYQAYLDSAHYTNNFNVVGCQDCHGGGAQHNGVGPLPYPNPDTAGKCFECHKNYLPKAHYFNYTATGTHNAQYVSKNYEKSCTSCHDPHKADKGIGQEHKDWAENHGNVADVPFAEEDFKDNTSCLRCHTATGYINFVTSGYTLATASWADPNDNSREVITCKACHTDYNFKNRVRDLPKVIAPYNSGKNPITYPDQSASNICIACHSGRQSADSVRAVADFTNASVPTSHYLGAAATFYGLAGFHYYTSNVKYNTGYNIGADTGSWNHGRLGVTDPATGNNFVAVEGTPTGVLTDSGNRGPCVTCHLGNAASSFPNTRSHTFDPFITANSTAGLSATATNNGCYGCHNGEDLKVVAEEEKAIFDADMDMYKFTLAARGIYYNDDRPNFRNGFGSAAKEIKNWVAVSPSGGSGMNTMGAAFDYYLLAHDLGMHVHNRAYARYLIFDSIQYLQNGTVTYSNQGTTINYYQQGVPKTIVIPRSGGTADINSQISFTAYSTAISGASPTWIRPAGLASITTMKGHLVRFRSADSKYYRR